MQNTKWTNACLMGALFTYCAVKGLADIPSPFHVWYLLMVATLIYGGFAKAGLASIWDVIGWLSARNLPPTSECPPRTTRIDPDVPRTTASKIGLVLAGGGGKGAYHIGCWSVLRERGVALEAVAGTSAGALNVAMIVRGSVETAKGIWSNLSASQLIQIDGASLPFLPFVVERYSRTGDRSITRKIVASALSVVILIFLLFVAWNFALMSRATHGPAWRTVVLLSMLCLGVLITVLHMILLAVCKLSSRPGLLPQPSLFRTSRLRDLIADLVPKGSFVRSPVAAYITVAMQRPVLDPAEKPRFVRRWSGLSSRRLMRLGHHVYLARYLRLDKVEEKEGIQAAQDFLRLSSTLPVVFPVQRLDNDWIADGGLADNLPIRPLLRHGCTRIFVVHLDDTAEDEVSGRRFDVTTREGLIAKLQYQERLDQMERMYARFARAMESLGVNLVPPEDRDVGGRKTSRSQRRSFTSSHRNDSADSSPGR